MLSTTVITLTLSFASCLANGHQNPSRSEHHNAIVDRHSDNATTVDLVPRGGDKRFTWYWSGQGACGDWFTDSDYVVALNEPQWDGGSHCHETVTLSYGGKTHTAKIVDQCPSPCPYGALDLSRGLFSYFYPDFGKGTLYGDWSFGEGGNNDPPPSRTTHHTTTHKTSTTSKYSSTTTSSSSSTTSSSSSSSTSTTSTSHSSSTSSSTSTTATSTATVSPDDPGTINQLNIAYLQLSGLVASAVQG